MRFTAFDNHPFSERVGVVRLDVGGVRVSKGMRRGRKVEDHEVEEDV